MIVWKSKYMVSLYTGELTLDTVSSKSRLIHKWKITHTQFLIGSFVFYFFHRVRKVPSFKLSSHLCAWIKIIASSSNLKPHKSSSIAATKSITNESSSSYYKKASKYLIQIFTDKMYVKGKQNETNQHPGSRKHRSFLIA